MRINYIHSFDVSVDEAKRIQKELAKKVVLEPGPPPEKVKHIAGVDVSYEKSYDTAYAVVVVLEFPSLELKEIRFSSKKSPFPYIPGFLSFRELPPLLEAMSQLTIVPDIVCMPKILFAKTYNEISTTDKVKLRLAVFLKVRFLCNRKKYITK